MSAETHRLPAHVTVTVTLALDPTAASAALALGAGGQVLGVVSGGRESRPFRGWLELLAVLESHLPSSDVKPTAVGL